jgi:hypothetical protein
VKTERLRDRGGDDVVARRVCHERNLDIDPSAEHRRHSEHRHCHELHQERGGYADRDRKAA